LIYLFWFVFSIGVGVLAANKGRSGFGWFLLSMLISPLLGLLFAAVAKDLAREKREAAQQPGPTTHVKCAKCAEWVLPEATVCKHCGSALAPATDFPAQVRAVNEATAKGKRADMMAALITLGIVILVVVVISAVAGK
jgi:ribosomal protein L32